MIQPAVSQALKNHRHHFEDELFLRTPTGLQATSFTDKLVGEISPILDDLSAALNDRSGFDPSIVEETIRIALSPNIASFLAGKVFDRVRAQSPAAGVHLTSWNAESLEDLVKGDLHFGVNLEIEQTPKEVMMQKLADDYFTCYVREDHPLAVADTLNLKDLVGLEFASLIIPDWNTRVTHIERLMKSSGYSVRVSFRSDQSAAVTEVIRKTDMLYPASSFIDPQNLEGLRSFRVKLNNRYLTYPVNAYYHQKNRRNPLTLWLSDILGGLLVTNYS